LTTRPVPQLPPDERAVIVALAVGRESRDQKEQHLYELMLLADTAGAAVVGKIIQSRPKPDPSYYIGRGKINALRDLLGDRKGDVVIFDADLSPSQVRNLQDFLSVKVIDRTGLILDIFARNARSRSAKIQVELAQLRYLYPKLTGAWAHFGQQTGGIGTRGPGETQLETDRRIVQKKISDLKKELKKVERIHFEQSKHRNGIPQICLVGYTNSGKSTLLNRLVRENKTVENRLFSTLDTTTRKMYLQTIGTVLISDTVGFIRRLPAHLMESFRSTLSVASEADVLLHVIDSSSVDWGQHVETVEETLRVIGAEKIPKIVVFNKIDLSNDSGHISKLARSHRSAVFISAKENEGITNLKSAIESHFGKTKELTTT